MTFVCQMQTMLKGESNLKLTELSDLEILSWLDGLAKKYDIKLTLTYKLFYIGLLHKCEESGEYDAEMGLYYLTMTTGGFSSTFGIGCTTVTDALKLLCKCNVIIRRKRTKKTDGASSELQISKGFRTYINTHTY